MLITEDDAIKLSGGARAISKIVPPDSPIPWKEKEEHTLVVDGRDGDLGRWVVVSVSKDPFEARCEGPRAEAMAKGEGYSSIEAWRAAMMRKYKTIPKGVTVVRIGLRPVAADTKEAEIDPSVMPEHVAYAVGVREF